MIGMDGSLLGDCVGRHDDSPYQEGDILAEKYRVERVLGVGGLGAVGAARAQAKISGSTGVHTSVMEGE